MTSILARTDRHSSPRTQMADFRRRCEAITGSPLAGPEQLHTFSVRRPEEFWRTFLDWSGLPWSGSARTVLTGTDVETARFFPDVRLNYAEALLRHLPGVDDDRPALTSLHAGGAAERYSRAELREAVQRTATALATRGTGVGGRAVLIAPNHAGAAVAALAATALGAAVSTAPPDMGAVALLNRLAQVEPELLIVDRTGVTAECLDELVAGLGTLGSVLLLDDDPLPDLGTVEVERLSDVVAAAGSAGTVDWPRLPFDHPLFILFSSGTTGAPKAIVHGAGGTLLEHVKEHRLHGDLRPEDTLYFHTTTGWMMWNWQLSALAVGAHVVLYDGPVLGPDTLWTVVAEHAVTVFGTSPAYLQLCQDAGYRPADGLELCRLRTVLSTGAVLHDWQYDWLASAVGPVPLQSISGGTDIIGCFLLGHPEMPVRRGRSSARSLGLDVAAVDEHGRELVDHVGELVCRRPFPSRPVGFLQDADGDRFHASYFAQHPGVWTHGDLVDFDEDGSARLHGRSDGVLNVNGIRIGPSEIYTILRGLPEIADTLAVEQSEPECPGRSRLVLLVVLTAGARLDGGLDRTIRRTLRREASAAHVPGLVVAVPELPVTHNGKLSERAARAAVAGEVAPNLAALRNPSCVEVIAAAVRAADPSSSAGDRGAATDVGLLQDAARIWCEVLGVRDAEPEDDFADLGGTSRQLMSLLRRVKLDLGADVSIQDFAHRPTLHGLVQAVDAAGSADLPSVPLLRPGRGRPVFLVCDAWGQLNSYAALVGQLATERPVYGLRLAVADDDGRHRTVPEVALDGIQRMREVQPTGPYSLIGYSFGGLVAYAMATELADRDEPICFLGLLDVLPPAAALRRWEATARRAAGRFAAVLAGELRDLVAQRLRGADSVAPLDSEQQFFVGVERVANDFLPRRYRGEVTYFLAEGRLPVVGNTLAAWRRAAPRLRVVEVPGHHTDVGTRRTSILGSRHVGALAARVSATLD